MEIPPLHPDVRERSERIEGSPYSNTQKPARSFRVTRELDYEGKRVLELVPEKGG